MRTFMNLTSVDLGFAPDGIIVGRMSLQGTSAEDADARQRLLEQGLARIRAAARRHGGRRLEQRTDRVRTQPGDDAARGRAHRSASCRGLALCVSRLLLALPDRDSRRDDVQRRPSRRPSACRRRQRGVCAHLFRPGGRRPGKRFAFGNEGRREIIGVVADVKARSNAGFVRSFTLGALGAATAPAVYVPVAQAPDAAIQIANRFFDMKWIVRTSGSSAGALEPAMREAIRALDPTLAVHPLRDDDVGHPPGSGHAASVDDPARRVRHVGDAARRRRVCTG